ncbi:MAG: hypothetical protein KFH87_01400 [Bacteroidetes bacterium]|nr:hypothetical protein [Bacteroidota bacterium]
MQIRVIAAALTLMILVGCGASINPVTQQRVVEWFGKTSSTSYNATSAFQRPMTYKVGQYVVYGITDGDDRSVYRTALVGKDGDAWIMETKNISAYGESTTQMAVRGLEKVYESFDIDDMDILWVKMQQDDGQVQTIDGMTLSLVKGTYKKSLTGLVMRFDAGQTTGSVRVPGGTFDGCTKVTSKVETFFGDYESDVWLHPEVPLNGVVRSVSKDNDTVSDLLEFGSDAEPSF